MIDTFEDTLKRAKKVVFLTGAGISQESGISTFRGTDGLWKKDVNQIANYAWIEWSEAPLQSKFFIADMNDGYPHLVHYMA
jgi:NAD-dependent SIR2 family protein deacetylase